MKINRNKKRIEIRQPFAEQVKKVKPVFLQYGTDEVKVTPLLPFGKRAEMINDIVGLVFGYDNNTINNYCPQYIKLAKRYVLVEYYTDYKLPQVLDDAWVILNYTSLYDDVLACLGDDIFDIFNEADEAIAARRGYLENKTDINALAEKLISGLENVGTQFSNIDLNSLMEILKNFSQTSPEDLVKSILKAKKEVKHNDKEAK